MNQIFSVYKQHCPQPCGERLPGGLRSELSNVVVVGSEGMLIRRGL